MSRLTLIARLLAKTESAEVVKTELLKLIVPTRSEVGCIEYRLHQDNDDPALFFFYETWENEARLATHKETDHYRNCFSAIEGMLLDRSLNKLAKIEP